MKKTRVLSVIAAGALMATMMAGCGNTSSKADPNKLAIGGIGPLTGDAASYGQAVEKGAKLAVKEINEAGGINGILIDFNFQDDENDPEKAVNAYNTLKDWGMQLSIGTVTSKPGVAVVEKTKEDNMFLLTPSGSAEECVKYDNAFRVCFSDPNQGAKSAQYIAEHNLAEKIAVIYDSSDVYSTGIFNTFKAEAENRNLEIVAETAFTSDTKTDFSVQIQQAKDAGADLVFLPIYYAQAALILQQANSAGYTPKFFGCDGLDGLLTVKDFDTSLAEGVMLLTPFVADAEDEATQKFVAAYKAEYDGETPIQFAADAYDAIYAIKAAAEKAGLTLEMSVSEMCEAMKKAMTEITLSGVTGSAIEWEADGEPNKEPKAMKIENGTYTAM